jgi:UDP-GlcNAc:undecaprenyl-phosphate GlcNAc-1-phosphate transferase
VIAFIIALGSSLLFVPLVRWMGVRYGLVVQPRQERWHRKPTPILGGVAILAAFLVGLIASLAVEGVWGKMSWGLLAGSVLMFGLGIYDDIRPISPTAKLVGQILAATLAISLGYTSTFFSPRIDNEILAHLPNILFTFFWLVGITNAINLLDNMDGLAGGISLVTAGILAYFFWRAGGQGLLWVCLALVGSLLGFLVYNFPPATIFMGDSGSLFLGFTLAVLAIAHQQQASNVLAVLGVPTLLFLLPILDTTLVTFTRLLRGQSPAQGGRDHTSHRLIAFGLSERQTLLVLYSVALASGILAAALESLNYWLSLALAPILIVLLALFTAYLGRVKVTTTDTSSRQGGALARIMLELTYRRRLLEIVLDFFLIGLAYYLAFLTRYGMVMDESRLNIYLQSLPLALGCTYLSFYVLGVYRGVWQYVDFSELVRYFQASLGSLALLAGLVFLLNSSGLIPWMAEYSPLIIPFFGVFLFVSLAASRSSFRLLDLFTTPRGREDEQRVLIYGSGDAAEMALRWIMMNPDLKFNPVGLIDDDPLMVGRQIHGVEVLGDSSGLKAVLENRQIDGIILAGLDSHFSIENDIRVICKSHDCWLRRLRLEFEILEID